MFNLKNFSCLCFLGLENFHLARPFWSEKVTAICEIRFTILSKKNCNPWASAVYISGLKKPRAVEPSGLKKTMRHKIFQLSCDKAVDNQITLNPSAA